MRDIKDQIKEINRRRDIYTDIKRLRRKIIEECAACLSCILLVIIVAFNIPALEAVSEQTPVKQYGSMILAVPTVGYVLIAVLFFILGIAVTLLCQHYRKYKEKEQDL